MKRVYMIIASNRCMGANVYAVMAPLERGTGKTTRKIRQIPYWWWLITSYKNRKVFVYATVSYAALREIS